LKWGGDKSGGCTGGSRKRRGGGTVTFGAKPLHLPGHTIGDAACGKYLAGGPDFKEKNGLKE